MTPSSTIDLLNTDPFLLFFGTFYLVLGFSCFFAKQAWQDFADLFVENEALSLIMGIIVLPISLFIVVFYNDWSSLASTILMIIGYMALLKALILLVKPCVMQAILRKDFVRQWIWLDGVAGMLLGLSLLFL